MYRASREVVAADETARQFVDLLDAVEVIDAPLSARPMRVVLMGRTMAGKSTLLAALTGGSQDRVGIGAQRTSRDVFAAPALDSPDVEIVDTPGVGAKDGAEDVALAMAEVPGADLVLWVASNDSFQEETAQALRAVAYRGKPVVVVLNCRARLVDDLDREDFLEDPDSVFDQHEGHFKTIRAHLSSEGIRPVAEVRLHAEAARQARTDNDFGSALREASRVDRLLEVLDDESRARRTGRRVLREADEVRTQAQTVGEVVAYIEQQIRDTVQVARGMREDQERRFTRLVDACLQTMQDDVIRIIGARQGWHQTVADFGPQVADEWEREQTALVADLDGALKDRLTQLARAVNEASTDAQREWTTAIGTDLKIEGLRDFRGLWKRQAAGLVVGGGGTLAAVLAGIKLGVVVGAKLGAAGGVAAGGVGAAPGAALGGVAGALTGAVTVLAGAIVVTPLRKKVQSLFTSKAKILEENRELLQAKIGEVLEDVELQMLVAVSEAMEGVKQDLAAGFMWGAEAEAAALGVAEVLASQPPVISTALSTLDRETIGCLLLADGRPRLAASVEKVTRLAGVCTAIQVTDEAQAEAWLFPPSSPELLVFGRAPSAGLPGACATSYVLGLTEQVPESIRSRRENTIVATDAHVPDQVLAAWSATLSDHLGTQIEIANPSAPRSISR
ncbi:GTPase domain-containing protein [Sanguibacter sp. 25GB23B1]|uniref:GTPase domain-containing protein n=1 Tax=unclassified Sanguibacter TaxID=2645534 RepID=UPI0032AED6C8